MKEYVCAVCGYEYDTERGVPGDGIDPGTPFEDVPDDFVCPVCSADKKAFTPKA